MSSPKKLLLVKSKKLTWFSDPQGDSGQVTFIFGGKISVVVDSEVENGKERFLYKATYRWLSPRDDYDEDYGRDGRGIAEWNEKEIGRSKRFDDYDEAQAAGKAAVEEWVDAHRVSS